MLRKIECFIQPSKLSEVKEVLMGVGVEGITVSNVEGFGRQRGYLNGQATSKKIKFLPKIKLEMVVSEEIVDRIVALIVKLAKSSKIGSGKIFILPVEDAIRIRTSETGKNAII